MPRALSASDRSSLIRLASSLPAGSPEKRAILAGLAQTQRASGEFNIPGKNLLGRANFSAALVKKAGDGDGLTASDATELILNTDKALIASGLAPVGNHSLNFFVQNRVNPKEPRFHMTGEYAGPATLEDLADNLKKVGWNVTSKKFGPPGSPEYNFQHKSDREVKLSIFKSDRNGGLYSITFGSPNSALKLSPEEETKILNDFAEKVGNVLRNRGSEVSGGSKLSGGRKATRPDEHIIFSLGKSDLPLSQIYDSKDRIGEDIRKKLGLYPKESGTFHYSLSKYVDALHKWIYVAVVMNPVYVGQEEYFSANITVYMSGYTQPKLLG